MQKWFKVIENEPPCKVFMLFDQNSIKYGDDRLTGIYRAVKKKCPGERHIIEPRGLFQLKEQLF